MEFTCKEIRNVVVTHYDFCTTACRGNIALIEGEVVGAYLRRHARPDKGEEFDVVWGGWSPRRARQFDVGLLSPHEIGIICRFARRYGKRRETAGDGWKYLVLNDDKTYTDL